MSDGRVIVAEKNIDTLMQAMQQLQDLQRDNSARLDWIEKKLVEVENMHTQLFSVLHTINLQSLGAAVQQLQEKYRELLRKME